MLHEYLGVRIEIYRTNPIDISERSLRQTGPLQEAILLRLSLCKPELPVFKPSRDQIL